MPECATCRFYASSRPSWGNCRRFPPGPEIVPIPETWWCGEHQPTPSVSPLVERTLTDDAAHFEKLAAEANRDLVVGGGDSIPPQHRAEYQAELKRLVAPANETLSLQPVAKPGRPKTRTPYQ